MIKNYTAPQKKAIWAKYQPLVRILFICSILASVYSGITEFYKFYSTFSIPSSEARFTAALALTLLIELALRGFSKMLFETIFEPAEQDEEEEENGNEIVKEKARPVMIGFLVIAVLSVGYVSTTNSLDGKSTYIEDTYQPPVEKKANDQAAKVKEQKARNQFEADSLKVLAEVLQKIKGERTRISIG
jgi:formate hydrogenlyase subunit 3/multisubunit Na+/H+ antiporter MnhD subunit